MLIIVIVASCVGGLLLLGGLYLLLSGMQGGGASAFAMEPSADEVGHHEFGDYGHAGFSETELDDLGTATSAPLLWGGDTAPPPAHRRRGEQRRDAAAQDIFCTACIADAVASADGQRVALPL